MYFRTKKNNYGIDIIVAIESDATLVNTTNNTWLESDDSDCLPGSYWVSGQCVAVGSSDYDTLVGAVIAAAREAADAAQRIVDDAALAERKAIAAQQFEDNAPDVVVADADPDVAQRKVLTKELRKPLYIPIRELDNVPKITTENLAHWEEVLADTIRTISGIENDTDDDPDIVRFPEPITYLEGKPEEHTVEFILLPDEDKDSYIAHWTKVKDDQVAWVAHMKTVLGV